MKKILFVFVILFSISLSSKQVKAVVDLPNTVAFPEYANFKAVWNEELVWAAGYNPMSLIDLKKGEVLKSISPKNDEYYVSSFAVSDDQKKVAYIRDNEIEIYDEFGELEKKYNTILKNNEEIKEFFSVEFLPNSHDLIIISDEYSNGKLMLMDLDTYEIKYARGTSNIGEILTSDKYIAVVNKKDAYIYDHNGIYETVIHSKTKNSIQAFDFSRDGLLILGENTNKLSVYDATRNFEELDSPDRFLTNMTRKFNDIDIDQTGQFIAVTYDGYDGRFSLFDRSGKKINTSLDHDSQISYGSSVALTKGAQSVIVRTKYSQSGVFSGRNIIKRPIAVNIPKQYQEVTMGTSKALSLEITQADGKKVTVKEGIKWATDAPTKASIKSNQLVGKGIGTYTLRATYEGFVVSLKGKVIPPPKLSSLKDIPWLQRHRQGILTNKTFEGSVAPNSSYKKVTGESGKLYIPKTTEIWNGKWNKNILYSRYASYDGNDSNQIDMVVMLPSLEKRNLSKAEVKEAFGKVTKVYTYKKPSTYYVDKSNKNFAKYTVSSALTYHINGQYLYIAFDKKDRVCFLALSSLN